MAQDCAGKAEPLVLGLSLCAIRGIFSIKPAFRHLSLQIHFSSACLWLENHELIALRQHFKTTRVQVMSSGEEKGNENLNMKDRFLSKPHSLVRSAE